MLKRLFEIVAISGLIALAACNTVRGAGDDVKSVANAADNVI